MTGCFLLCVVSTLFLLNEKGAAFVYISRYAPSDSLVGGALHPCLGRVSAVHLFCAHAQIDQINRLQERANK